LAALVAERGVTVAAAESLTSGNVSAAIGAAPSAQDWFAGAVTAYSVEVKQKLLGLAEGVDPCSSECAETMAAGVRELLGADVAVSTTGVGGPDPQDGHPAGTVYIGWATASGTGSRLFTFDADASEVVHRTTSLAVDLLIAAVGGVNVPD
jgi:nicotinamide-nucleotide amidase